MEILKKMGWQIFEIPVAPLLIMNIFERFHRKLIIIYCYGYTEEFFFSNKGIRVNNPNLCFRKKLFFILYLKKDLETISRYNAISINLWYQYYRDRQEFYRKKILTLRSYEHLSFFQKVNGWETHCKISFILKLLLTSLG